MRTISTDRPRRRRAPALLLAGLLAAGCGMPDDPADVTSPADAVDEDTFVAVFVALRRAAASAPTDEAFARDRDRILGERGVTEPDLERFIDDHAEDVQYLSEVWDRIDRTLRGELDANGDPVQVPDADLEGDGGSS